MWLPRGRITVRRLMIAIVGLAVVLWAGQTGWRWHDYRRRAAFSAQVMADRIAGIEAGTPAIASERQALQRIREAQRAVQNGEIPIPEGADPRLFEGYGRHIAIREAHITTMEEAIRNSRVDAAYHARLYWKYQNAAARPWLQVAPDPPVPQSVADLEQYLTPMDEALIDRLKPTLPPPSPGLESPE
jgi:hypothetical protein